jgi:von Willebrand factor type D domain/PEP-CTERM motif
VLGAFATSANGINNAGQIVGAASATGDPHFTTYDGTKYSYQGVGDFVLTQSPIDQFDVQVQTTGFMWNGGAVSMMTQAAATLCNHDVTFDTGRASAGGSFVELDGSPTSLSVDNPVAVGACEIVELSPSSYQLDWNTGEILDITDNGFYLDLTSQLSWIDGLGPMDGLLSSDLNPDSWRVSGAASLFDPVPEPSSLILLSLGIGLTGLAITRRRRFAGTS